MTRRSRFPGALLVLVLFGTLFGTPAGASGQSADFQLEIREHTLANGVEVLVHERPAAGRIGARIFYRSDIAGERPGIWGSMHMLEHSMFKGSRFIGTTDWEAEREVAERVERLAREVEDERNRLADLCRSRDAFVPDEVEPPCTHPRLDSLRAEYDAAVAEQDGFTLGTDLMRVYQYAGGTNMTASTGADWMKFDIDLPADKLELFMYVERSRLEFPVWRQFDPEREVVVQQIQSRFNLPEGPFEREMQALTYLAHPYGQPHWIADLEASQREDHWELFYKFMIPQNTAIVVVGEVEAERVFELAERYFGDWQPGRPSPRVRTIEPRPVGPRRVETTASTSPVVAINARIPAVGHADLPVLDVLAAALGGSEGWLMRRLGEGATAARASAMIRKYPGHFSLRVNAADNESLSAVEGGVNRILDGIAVEGLPTSEIERAVAHLRFQRLQGFEEIGSSAVRIGAAHAIHHWSYLNDLPRLWGEVTPQDLARVARAYLAPDLRVTGVLRRGEPAVARAASSGTPAAGGSEAREDGLTGGAPAGASPTPSASAASRAPSEPAASAEPSAVGSERVPEPMAGVAARTGALPPAFSGAPPRVAETVWWTPPWMAQGGDERFAGSDIPDDYRDLEFPSTTFEPPTAEGRRATFDNGLRILVVEDDYLPVLRMTAYLDVTPLEDPTGREGITELMIELLRYGGTAALSPEVVEERLAAMGATLTHGLDRTVARFDLVVPAEAGEQAVALLASLLASPGFDEGAFQRYRERLAVRWERALDNPFELVERTFDELLYGEGHPMARRPGAETVRRLTAEDVRGLHRQSVVPERMTFALSGPLSADALRAAVADAFGTSVGAEARAPAPRARSFPEVAPPQGRVVRTVERGGMRQGHVRIGHQGIGEHPEDAAALELMHYVLCGGGFGSRMMDLLRTRTGITAALYCELEPGLGVTNPYVWRFSGRPETLADGVLVALREIARMRDDGLTAEELEAARTAYLEGYIPAAYDTPHKTAQRLAHLELLGVYPYGRTQYLNFYAGDRSQMDAIRSVTIDDANRAARAYLDPENIVITVVGDLDVILGNASPEARALLEGR